MSTPAQEVSECEPNPLSVSVDALVPQGEERQKPGVVSKILWALCQCVMDNDYHETISIEESSDEAFFLPPQKASMVGRNTLILDLDETLIHSSLEPQPFSSFTLSIDNEGGMIYVATRPGLSEFLERTGQHYELAIFTASMPGYANPVIDKIDPNGWVSGRLYRSCCRLMPFGFLKDLGRLGRDLRKVIILDVRFPQNSPQSYALHPGNALPISSWFNDPSDHELLDLLPLLDRLSSSQDVVADLTLFHPRSKPTTQSSKKLQ